MANHIKPSGTAVLISWNMPLNALGRLYGRNNAFQSTSANDWLV